MKPRNMPERKRLRQATALTNLVKRGEPTAEKVKTVRGTVRIISKPTRVDAYYQELATLDHAVNNGEKRHIRSKINRSSGSLGR